MPPLRRRAAGVGEGLEGGRNPAWRGLPAASKGKMPPLCKGRWRGEAVTEGLLPGPGCAAGLAGVPVPVVWLLISRRGNRPASGGLG